MEQSKTLINGTLSCQGVTGQQQVKGWTNGNITVDFGYHFIVVLETNMFGFPRLDAKDFYTYVTHHANFQVGVDMELSSHYFKQQVFSVADVMLNPLSIQGIANVGPKLEIDFVMKGKLQANIASSFTTGFKYDPTTSRFDEQGKLIEEESNNTLANPHVTEPILNINGRFTASLETSFRIRLNANVGLQLPAFDSDQGNALKLVEGEIGFQIEAGFRFDAEQIVTGNLTQTVNTTNLIDGVEEDIDNAINMDPNDVNVEDGENNNDDNILGNITAGVEWRGELNITAFIKLSAYYSGTLINNENVNVKQLHEKSELLKTIILNDDHASTNNLEEVVNEQLDNNNRRREVLVTPMTGDENGNDALLSYGITCPISEEVEEGEIDENGESA
eukprot:Pgem_evm1s468